MKSILFKPFLIDQILKKNKTQTWQIIKTKFDWDLLAYKGYDGSQFHTFLADTACGCHDCGITAKYSVGETIYVKEKLIRNCCDGISFENGEPIYGTDWVWKRDVLSPLFMPQGLARLFLSITDVRVKRLQDITEEDAIKEGVKMVYNSFNGKDDR